MNGISILNGRALEQQKSFQISQAISIPSLPFTNTLPYYSFVTKLTATKMDYMASLIQLLNIFQCFQVHSKARIRRLLKSLQCDRKPELAAKVLDTLQTNLKKQRFGKKETKLTIYKT